MIGESECAPLYRCHLNGGVLLALDQACALIGAQPPPTLTPVQKKAAAEAAAAANAANAALLPPTDAAPPAHSSPPSLGGWPSLLPFFVGLSPPAPSATPEVLAWRRLRSVALGAAADDSAAGYAAVGLPPGCVVAALTPQRCKLRPMLGSAAPRTFTREAMRQRAQAVTEAQAARKVEAEREKKLAELREAYQMLGETFPPEPKPGGPHVDHEGTKRGHCPRCNACPGFEVRRRPTPSRATHAATALTIARMRARPRRRPRRRVLCTTSARPRYHVGASSVPRWRLLRTTLAPPPWQIPNVPHVPGLLATCVHCGCDARCHERMRDTAAEAREARDDDILRRNAPHAG